ncbi:replication protein [Rhodovulum sulfidophilum]|uniref:ParB N-terminal domain-containing protein n=1 Tax=Rhodovulum visakhapatnamense TaxID=364297 RepID=A0ABS1RGF4_9RHOB|nr:ParB N-terminal domain-containing protein [Rhodovulum visakhapatnamense]MBL3569987.1 ParB N-terminal domain-containing protein [Rhodovulum visakhapatnamense]MBL3577816.1 ParB N-terminal domain-containing protein [Rhodovulum visakhapatnamense]OLS42350.1 replication protein [Rhodovulum sulfidophilum]
MVRKKRRMFDIDMPEDMPAERSAEVPNPPGAETPAAAPETKTFPAGKVGDPSGAARRRGPMATAIGETAHSARERQEIEARIRAENDALAHEHVRLKRLGLVLESIPLEAIDTAKLVRDRKPGADPELEDLKASIVSIGLSNPIRVEAAGQGRYELIQGYRRLAAYKALLAETGDAEAWGTIPAAVMPEGEGIETLYRRMVDENLVRKDISFYEMAQLAVDYAADPATPETDPDRAVALLFKSARYQKRSYIRGFIKVVERMKGILAYPEELPRALGLALAQRLEEDPECRAAIAETLKGWEGRTVADELAAIRQQLGVEAGAEEDTRAAPKPAPKRAGGSKAKTSFQLNRKEGRARCTAADGRLEIRLPRDFSTIDRRRLEEAVRQMLDRLE